MQIDTDQIYFNKIGMQQIVGPCHVLHRDFVSLYAPFAHNYILFA